MKTVIAITFFDNILVITTTFLIFAYKKEIWKRC